MEFRLQLKPFERKDWLKYKIIQITDIHLHSSIRRSTVSVGEKVKESFEQGTPGRFYGFKTQELNEKSGFDEIMTDFIKQDPELVKMVQEEEKNGYKILFSFPTEGIPVKLGVDTSEFINSKNGKRIIRKLNIEKEV